MVGNSVALAFHATCVGTMPHKGKGKNKRDIHDSFRQNRDRKG